MNTFTNEDFTNALRARGIETEMWHTGGGIMNVIIPLRRGDIPQTVNGKHGLLPNASEEYIIFMDASDVWEEGATYDGRPIGDVREHFAAFADESAGWGETEDVPIPVPVWPRTSNLPVLAEFFEGIVLLYLAKNR